MVLRGFLLLILGRFHRLMKLLYGIFIVGDEMGVVDPSFHIIDSSPSKAASVHANEGVGGR
jgi:hypothetical protein